MRVAEIVARGHDVETVKKVERLLYIAEYKRRQSAPGVKVTQKNFGRDRRYPIVNRFRDPGGAGAVPRRRRSLKAAPHDAQPTWWISEVTRSRRPLRAVADGPPPHRQRPHRRC